MHPVCGAQYVILLLSFTSTFDEIQKKKLYLIDPIL